MKKILLTTLLLLCVIFVGFAHVNTYDVADQGYLRKPMEAKNGLVLTNNRYSEIYLLQDNQLKTLVKGRGAGIYTEMSKDKTLVGFKSINDDDLQAPAVVHVATGVVNILEDYVWECGQVSFADDGTMAYTMGDKLIVRKGGDRKSYDLGFYTNIVKLSPDAKHVAYGHIEGQYYIKNLETGAVEQVPVVDGYDGVWSPDGSKLAIQTATGRLAVLEQATKRVYDLGEGVSANWANNSEELIFTKLDRNDIQINGASVQKMRFDGSNAVTLISSTEDMPTDALLTSDDQLVVPYAGELKRCVAIRPMPKATVPGAATLSGAAQEKVVYDIVDGEFGARFENINKASLKNGGLKNIKGKASVQMEGTIGNEDIPYISQVYDSPTINGCYSYGHVTSASTSAIMHLGYYDLLPKKTTTSRSGGSNGPRTQQYAHCIGDVFTNKKGTTTFNIGTYKDCATIYGGYGYMWQGSNSPGNGQMGTFYTLNGASSATYCWSSGTAWTQFKERAAAGDAYPLCIALYSSGHLILGFRTNCYYSVSVSDGGFVSRTGCIVCHDPYGDANDGTWADDDGQHSSYDWLGYNSGRANIGTYYWSIDVRWPAGTTPGGVPAEPASLVCNPTSVELSGEVGSTDEIYKDVKVTGTSLTTAIAMASATSAITPEKLSGWDDLKGGTLRLKLNTNFTKGAGTYESYVAVQSTSSYRVDIKTKVTLIDPNAGSELETPEISCDSNVATFDQSYVGSTSSKSIIVTGTNLIENISVTCSDNTNYSVTPTTLGTSGGTLTVIYKPQTAGTHNATITLTSGTASTTVDVSGTAIENNTEGNIYPKIYINPGHGTFTANDRPMSTIKHGANNAYTDANNDTTNFFESNTNLQKGFGLLEQLVEYGVPFDKTKNQTGERWEIGAARDMSQNIIMSHVKCGPAPAYADYTEHTANPDNVKYNRNLSEIAAEVDTWGADMFISIHSNAYTEAGTLNYLSFAWDNKFVSSDGTLQEGSEGAAIRDLSIAMAEKSWDHRIRDRHTMWTNYDHPVSGGTVKIGYQNLGVLNHATPGFLVEGYFHTYQPARHRAMNFEVCRLEGIDYARGIADYFGIAKETTGDIYGVVRDRNEYFTHEYYTPRSGTYDVYKPLNEVTVTLMQGETVVATTKTDDEWNGAFIFNNVAPGDYTLTFSHDDYKANKVWTTDKTGEIVETSIPVTVAAAQTSYPTAFIEANNYVASEILCDIDSVAFGRINLGETITKNVIVETNVNISVSNSDNVNFTVSPETFGTSVGELSIVYNPQSVGSHTTTVTLTGATMSKTIVVSGNATNIIEELASGTSNPFAYDLIGSIVDRTLTYNYTLNTVASSARLLIYNETGDVMTANTIPTTAGSHTMSSDLSDLPVGKYSWGIEVKGETKTTVSQFVSHVFYHPCGLDVDNSFESPSFGTLFVAEGYTAGKTSGYHSAQADGSDGGGLYIFDPAGKPVVNPTTSGYRFYGEGLTHSNTYHTSTMGADFKNVAIADDGRIFVTRYNSSGDYILSAPSLEELVKAGKFTTSLVAGMTMTDAIYKDAEGNFIVGPMLSFDAKGAGEDTKLIAITRDVNNAAAGSTNNRVIEYALGEANVIAAGTPVAALDGKFTASYDKTTNVVYDNRGGIWYCQYRGTPSDTNPALVYVDAEGNIQYFEGDGGSERRRGSISVSPDGTKLAAAGPGGYLFIYDIIYNEDKTVSLIETFYVKHGMGNNLNALAWDAAGNLYAGNTSGEYVNGFSVPRADAFVTKAASKYSFTLEEMESKITCDIDSVAFGRVGVGAVVEKQIKVTAENTTENIKITSSDNTNFSMSSTGLDVSGGTLTVTYKPQTAGTHSATITLTSGTATKTIYVSGERYKELAGSYSKGLTKIWQNTTNLPAYLDTRYAAVSNGKLIVNDKVNNKILEIGDTGFYDYFDPSAILSEYYGACNLSTAVSCDDAGNILVGNGWGGALSGSNFTIVSADLSKSYKLDLSGISGYTTARTDQVGQVRGNMLSPEGAYFTILPTNGTQALVVKVANGALADAKLVTTGLTHISSSIAQPAYETVAEMAGNMATSFMLRERQFPANVYTWASPEATSMDKGYTFTSATSDGYTTTNASVEGFNWFKLGGKSYFIMPITTDGTINTRGSYFGIFDQDGNIVATWIDGQRVATESLQIYGSFIVEPADEKSVFIYHYLSGVVAEKLRFAISDVMNGVPVTPEISCDSNVATFDQSYVGSTSSKSIIVTGTNLIENISVTCSDNTNYSVTPTTLGTSAGTLTVTYMPQAAGTHTATITLSSGTATSTISVSGTAKIAPKIICDATTVTFGQVYIGEGLTNSVNIMAEGLSENIVVTCNNSNFYINPTALNATGGNVTIGFAPSKLGQQTATITFTSGSVSTSITATGTAVERPVVVIPEISCDQAAIDFGQNYVGESAARNVVVTGEGLSGNITVTCSDNTNFSVTPSSLGTIGGTLTVTYKPQATGSHNATITLTSGTVTKTIPISGTSILKPVPEIVCDAESLSFGDIYIGNTLSKDIVVTGKNLLGNIAVTSSDNVNFSLSATMLEPAGGTLSVTYNPQTMGSHSAAITLVSGSVTKIVMVAGAAEKEPVVSYPEGLTKIWQNTTNVPGTVLNGNVRYAAVSNGKLIANDMGSNKIIELTETGYKVYYDPSAALNAYYGQKIGTVITCDDVGNILVNSGYPDKGCGTNFMIVSADLSKTYKIDLSTIPGFKSLRIDQVGRVRGDMLSSEGSYVTILPILSRDAYTVKIANGAIAASERTTVEFSNTLATIAQPAYETVTEMSVSRGNSFVLRERTKPKEVYVWPNIGSSSMTSYTFAAETSEGYTTTAAMIEGFDWFKLGGVSYYVLPMTLKGDMNTLGSCFGIFRQDGKIVAYWKEGQRATGQTTAGSFVVVPNDNESVFIYHFMSGSVAEKLVFKKSSGSIGLEELEVEITAPAEYYNLQGIKVENPERGLYIKRQGSKTTKVIL